MVFASYPVASLIRFAALPVGAAKRVLTPRALKILRMELMMVVLPVPGWPVSTMTLDRQALFTASICLSAKVMSSFSWTHWTALSASISLMDFDFFMRVFSRLAMLVSEMIFPRKSGQEVKHLVMKKSLWRCEDVQDQKVLHRGVQARSGCIDGAKRQ